MHKLMKCAVCGKYTVAQCCGQTISAQPPKWSPEDKWAEWRRKAKEEQLKNEGLI